MASLTILSVLLIISDRLLPVVIPLTWIGVMIHEGYPLMFFPAVFALFFYSFYTEKDKDKKRKKFIILFLTTLGVGLLFVYFYFFSTPIENHSFEEVMKDFNRIYPKEIDEMLADNVKYIWFGAENYSLPLWENGKMTSDFVKCMVCLFYALVLNIFSVIFVSLIWISRIKKGKKYNLAEIMLFLTIFVTVPLFTIHVDTARWVYDVLLYEYIILSFIIIRDDKNTVDFFKKRKIINKTPVIVLFLCYIFCFMVLISYDKWCIFDIVSVMYYVIFDYQVEIIKRMWWIIKNYTRLYIFL